MPFNASKPMSLEEKRSAAAEQAFQQEKAESANTARPRAEQDKQGQNQAKAISERRGETMQHRRAARGFRDEFDAALGILPSRTVDPSIMHDVGVLPPEDPDILAMTNEPLVRGGRRDKRDGPLKALGDALSRGGS